MSDRPAFVRPTVGRSVHYFPHDERRRDVSFAPGGPPARLWTATITAVHEAPPGPNGEELTPFVVSLTAFPPPVVDAKELAQLLPLLYWIDPSRSSTAHVVQVARAPLAGMYDLEDLLANPEWHGCWNWPPRVV